MRNKISIKEYAGYAKVDEGILKDALDMSDEVKEAEDYCKIGNDTYLYLKGALWLTGRFAVTEDVSPAIILLAEQKKVYSRNSKDLPPYTPTEQSWNDGILPIIHANANVKGVDFREFLKEIYKRMNVNFLRYTADYLENCGLPNDTRVSKFHVVVCNKELRIKFEETMAQYMNVWSKEG